jgi:hypothetical protein
MSGRSCLTVCKSLVSMIGLVFLHQLETSRDRLCYGPAGILAVCRSDMPSVARPATVSSTIVHKDTVRYRITGFRTQSA